LAVEKDKSKGGKKDKKGKKGKKEKGKKGKKEKDLTANRTMESLVEELVKAGIFQKVDFFLKSCFWNLLNSNNCLVSNHPYPKL
jgi:hypothetical protein